MKKKICIGVGIIMGIASILGAVFYKKHHMPIEPLKQDGEVVVEAAVLEPSGEYIFLQELLKCDEAHAIKIAESFKKTTGKSLEKADPVEIKDKYKIIKVDTGDKTYFLETNSVSVLQEIREDTLQGKVIYQIIY